MPPPLRRRRAPLFSPLQHYCAGRPFPLSFPCPAPEFSSFVVCVWEAALLLILSCQTPCGRAEAASPGGVTLCGVTGGVCVVSRRPPPARGATPPSPRFVSLAFVVFPVGRYSLLPPPLIAGSLFRCRPRQTRAIAALLPKVLRPLFVLLSRGLVRCTREVRGCRAFSVLLKGLPSFTLCFQGTQILNVAELLSVFR